MTTTKRQADTKTKTPGVTKTQEGRYRGREPWRGGKSETFDAYKEACDYVAAARVRGKGNPAPQPTGAGKTMAEVWQSYSELRSDWSPNTRAARVRYWGHLAKWLAAIKADDITQAHATTVRNGLAKQPTEAGKKRSDGDIRNHLILFGALMSYAIDQGWRAKAVNPVKAAKVVKAAGSRKKGEGRARAIPRDVAELLIDNMPDHASIGGYIEHQLGIRGGEARGLQLDHIDWLRRTVRIDCQLIDVSNGETPDDLIWREGRMCLVPPKTDAGVRTIDVPQEVIDRMAAHLQQFPSDRWLLTGRDGGPITAHAMQRAWDSAKAACEGLLPRDGIVMHDLRHSFCTDLIDAGVPVPTVAELAGHESPSVTLDVYAHSTDVGRAAAKAAMQARSADRTNEAQTVDVGRAV